MNDRGIIATYLLSVSSKITNLKHTSPFKLVKDLNSNRVNDLPKNKTVAVTLYENLLIWNFELEEDFLKMITNKNSNVDLANLLDKKLMFVFAKEFYFDEKVLGNKSTWSKSPMNSLNHLLSWLRGFP